MITARCGWWRAPAAAGQRECVVGSAAGEAGRTPLALGRQPLLQVLRGEGGGLGERLPADGRVAGGMPLTRERKLCPAGRRGAGGGGALPPRGGRSCGRGGRGGGVGRDAGGGRGGGGRPPPRRQRAAGDAEPYRLDAVDGASREEQVAGDGDAGHAGQRPGRE